jgi:hypothetical protein
MGSRRLTRILGAARRPRGAHDPAPPPGKARRVPREKPPNVIGRGPLLASPGFGVVIVCIVKDEAPYLEEWLAYHLALGVDHVLVYDNGSSDGSAAVLERYQNHGLVTVVDWPLGGGQLAAYNHALRFFGATAEWLAYHDVDEFLVPLVDEDIPAMLARFPDAAVVHVPRREFGYAGHREPPTGLAIDEYTQVADVLGLDPALPPRVKSIVRPGCVNAIDIHLAFPADVPSPGAPTRIAGADVQGVAQLNHYYTRSLAEFEAKRVRGSATGRIERPAVPFDLPTLATDTTAQRFSARTRETLARLRRLEPRPYVYGSELRLDLFPRPNDLGRFAEFAIANHAAGLAQPARAPVRHLRNLYGGVGLVADLGSDDWRPTFGELSRSIHTGVLIEHMRGRLGASLAETPDGSARSRLEAGSAEIALALPGETMLRCWSAGFVLAGEAPLRIELSVRGRAAPLGEPVHLQLPASACLAGVVEVAARPREADELRLRVRSAAGVVVHDLFAISTG